MMKMGTRNRFDSARTFVRILAADGNGAVGGMSVPSRGSET